MYNSQAVIYAGIIIIYEINKNFKEFFKRDIFGRYHIMYYLIKYKIHEYIFHILYFCIFIRKVT